MKDKAKANQKLESVCGFFFGFCFVVGPFLMLLSKIFLSPRIWLLPTTYHKERDFATILVFVIVLEK
jgi:hypothetical protein